MKDADSGDTILGKCAQYGSLEASRLLLESGIAADLVNENDSLGYTPLMWAADRFDIELVKLFVRHGADINAVNSRDGSTVLTNTIERAPADFLKALVKLGADPKAGPHPSAVVRLAIRRYEKNANEDNRLLLEFFLGRKIKPMTKKERRKGASGLQP